MKKEFKHTKIILHIEPVGCSKGFNDTIIIENLCIDFDQVDGVLNYGSKYNYIIENHRNNSEFGILNDWCVVKVKKLTDADLDSIKAVEEYSTKNDVTYIKSKPKPKIVRKTKKVKVSEIVNISVPEKIKTSDRSTNTSNDATFNKLKEQYDSYFKYEDSSFWLDPKGVIHYVGFANHNQFAIDYIVAIENLHKSFEYIGFLNIFNEENHSKSENYNSIQYPYEYLEYIGWVRFLSWHSDKDDKFQPCEFKLTKEQYKTLKDFCYFTDNIFPTTQVTNLNELEL